MKRKLFIGVAIATLIVGGLSVAKRASHPTLTPLQMENLDALSTKEGWVEIIYDKNCVPGGDICVRTPTEVHLNAVAKNY